MLHLQMAESKVEVTRKHSRMPICECNQSHLEFDLHVWVHAHVITCAE